MNVYVKHLMQKGYSAKECSTPAKPMVFPVTKFGRVFNSQKEYDEAMADFLNGN